MRQDVADQNPDQVIAPRISLAAERASIVAPWTSAENAAEGKSSVPVAPALSDIPRPLLRQQTGRSLKRRPFLRRPSRITNVSEAVRRDIIAKHDSS